MCRPALPAPLYPRPMPIPPVLHRVCRVLRALHPPACATSPPPPPAPATRALGTVEDCIPMTTTHIEGVLGAVKVPCRWATCSAAPRSARGCAVTAERHDACFEVTVQFCNAVHVSFDLSDCVGQHTFIDVCSIGIKCCTYRQGPMWHGFASARS